MKLFAAYLLALCLVLPATAAELKVDFGHGVVTYRTETLLERRDARTISVPGDVAFHRTMHYRAVPLAALLEGIGSADHLQFVAGDGFAAEIPAALLLNTQGSTAWLAIEDPSRPWPALDRNRGSAGPFYLVWTRPQAAAWARNNGRTSWRASASWPAWPNAFRRSCPIPRCRLAAKCNAVSRHSSATVSPATRSTAKATPSSVRT